MRTACVWQAAALVGSLLAYIAGASRLAGTPSRTSSASLEDHTCPQYYVLGQMKCSTTTLFKHLRHELDFPGWGSSKQKSLHIFDQHDAERVLRNAKTIPPIDGTPSMLRALDAPLRLKALCKFASPPKFVVSLCDPANRTWSHFKHSERADQEKRPKYFSSLRPKLTDATLADAYRSCIRTTLPQLESCLSKLGFVECGHMLFGSSTPGAAPDALGNDKPCNGVVFSSLHTHLLERWFSVFPRKDFLVLDRDDWVTNQPAAVQAVSRFFGIPPKDSERRKISAQYVGNYHAQFDGVAVPEDVQAELRSFFNKHSGWEKHVQAVIGEAAADGL